MSETDIVWASGDVGSEPFFTRSEFEQFSCQYKLHDQILEKERELHPGGPVFGTTQTKVPELPGDTDVSQDTENGQQPSKETNIATTKSSSHAAEETELETAKTSSVQVKNEPTKPSSHINKPEDDTKKTAKKTKPVAPPVKSEKPVNTPASTAKKPPVWVVEEDEMQEEVVGQVFAGPHAAFQPRFPRTSWLTMEEHRVYLQLHKKCTGPSQYIKTPATTKELQRYKELHQKVMSEQEEFLVFTESEAARRPIAYRRIHPDAVRFTNEYLGCLCERVTTYPRYYVQQDSVPLIDKNTSFVPLVHVKCLLKMGEVPRAIMPVMETFKKPRLPVDYNRITSMFPTTQNLDRKPTCSRDTNAEKLAMKYSAEMVISASTIKCLLDHGNNMERQWELAVVVKEHVIEDVRGKRTVKVVYVDKPFPPKTMLTAQKNAWFHKFAMKSSILHKKHDNRHVFSKRHRPKANEDHNDIEDAGCDLDNLETFGVVSKKSERRPSAFKKYVRPEGMKSPTDVAEAAPTDFSNPEGDNSMVTEETSTPSAQALDLQEEPVNGKGFMRSGSQGFIPTVISPRLTEQALKGFDAAAVDISKPLSGVKVGESTEKDVSEKTGPCQGEENKPSVDPPTVPPIPPTTDKDHSPSNNETDQNNEHEPVKDDSEIINPIVPTQVDAKEIKNADPKESTECAESTTPEIISKDKEVTDKADTSAADSQTPSQEALKVKEERQVETGSSGSTEVKMEELLEVQTDKPTPTEIETARRGRRRSCRLAFSKADLATLQESSEPRIKNKRFKRCASEDVNTKYNDTKDIAPKVTAGILKLEPGSLVPTDESDAEPALVIDVPEDTMPKTRRGRRSGRLLGTASTEKEEATTQDHQDQVEGSEKDISEDTETVSDSKKGVTTNPPQGSEVGVTDDSDVEGLVIDIPEVEEVKDIIQPKRGRGRPRKAQTTPKGTQPRPVSPKAVQPEEVTTPNAAGEKITMKRVTRSQRASVVTDSVDIPVNRKRKSIIPMDTSTQPPEELKSSSPSKRTKNSPEEKEEKLVATPSDIQSDAIKDLDLDKAHFSVPLQHGVLQDSPFSPFLQDEDVLPILPLSPPPPGKGYKSRGSSVSEFPQLTDLPFSPHPPGSSNKFYTPFSPGSQYSSDSILSPFVQGHFKFAESPLSPYPHSHFNMADSPLSPCPEKHAKDKDKQKSHFGAIHDIKIIPLSPMYPSREMNFNLDAHLAGSQKDEPSSDQAKSRRGSVRRVSNVALPAQSAKKDARGTESAPSAPLSTLDQIMQAQESFLKPPTVKVEEKAKSESTEPKVEAATSSVAASIQKDPAEWVPGESPSDYETYDQDNLTYNLWLLGNIRLIIRCGIHGVVKHKKRSQFVSLTPKMEFQPAFGLEQVMPGESARNWVDFHIRHVDKLVRVRVNAYNSEVMMMDQLTMGDIINAKSLFNPLTATSRLHCVLEKLKSLPVGHYMLGHSPGNAHAHIKKSVSTTSGVYDLHKAYLEKPVGVINDDRLPWIPVDPTIQLYQHQKHQRIAATFIPKDSAEAAGSTWAGKSGWQGQQNRKKRSGKKKKKQK